MQKHNIPLSFLANYIKDEEVGYQVIDELVEIARGGDDKRTEFLLNEVAQSTEAIFVENHSKEIPGYEAIMSWREPTDTLICLNSGVMLLFPKHKDESYPTISKLISLLVV